MNWAGLLGSHQCPGRLIALLGPGFSSCQRKVLRVKQNQTCPQLGLSPGVGLTKEKDSFGLRVFRTSQGKTFTVRGQGFHHFCYCHVQETRFHGCPSLEQHGMHPTQHCPMLTSIMRCLQWHPRPFCHGGHIAIGRKCSQMLRCAVSSLPLSPPCSSPAFWIDLRAIISLMSVSRGEHCAGGHLVTSLPLASLSDYLLGRS